MKRRSLWLMLFLIPCLVFALLFHFRERSLLEHATILAENIPDAQRHTTYFLWLSDDKILSIGYASNGYAARVRDIKTGQEKPYRGKGTFFGNRSIDDVLFRLSPDSKRLLWVSNGNVLATDSNGTELGKWERQQGEAMYVKEWLPDSRHWVEAIERSNGTYAKVHGIGEADKPERKIQGLSDGLFLGFTSQKTLMAVDTEHKVNSAGQYQLLEVSLDGKTNSHVISLPFSIMPSSAVSVDEIILSPQGNKLAWLSSVTQPDNFIARWLGKLRLSQPLDETVYDLWTSDSDGKNAKRSGTITSLRLDTDAVPSNLMWLPNGRQVSFYYGNKLYAVDVE